MDKAKWLDDILQVEGIEQPVLVGQSMGGYVGQAYAEQFPEKLGDYISIDSAPLGREYMTRTEIWMLKHNSYGGVQFIRRPTIHTAANCTGSRKNRKSEIGISELLRFVLISLFIHNEEIVP